MKRFYVFQDGKMIGAAGTREEAVDMIRQHQRRETHYLVRSEYSIIFGEEEFVKYEERKKQ